MTYITMDWFQTRNFIVQITKFELILASFLKALFVDLLLIQEIEIWKFWKILICNFTISGSK